MARRNRFVAAVLSFLIGGLGQFYLFEWRVGVIYLLADLFSAAVYESAKSNLWLMANLVVSIASSVHAYRTAKRKEFKEHRVAKPEVFID